MTVRRVAALAQALTMITLLLPGSELLGPGVAQAALQRLDSDHASSDVFDATGRGIGCQPRSARFRGPNPPSDPPWPPGAEPTPTPRPQPSVPPSPESSAAPSPTAQATASTAFLQAEASLPPADAAPGGSDADITPDVPSRRGRSGSVRGIDISHHNDDIDFEKVRRAGYDFVFIKATQDNDFIDPMFVTNMAKAKAAGLSAGGYHFFDYTLDGTIQADHFVDRLELAGAIDGALPPVVDVECWAAIGSSIHAVSAARLRDFVARVYERIGRLPIIYTSVFMWREVVGNAEGFEDQPLWAACWGCDAPPSIAPGWADWAFWQTGIDRVRGVKRLDGNVFSGSVRISVPCACAPSPSRMVRRPQPARTSSWTSAAATRRTCAPHPMARPGQAGRRSVARLARTSGRRRGTTGSSSSCVTEPGDPLPCTSNSIALDLSGPELTAPLARLRLGPLGSADRSGTGDGELPIDVSWQASDAIAGLGDASVAVACDDRAAERSDAPGAADPGIVAPMSTVAQVAPGTDCDITVMASDGLGNTTRATSGGVVATVHVVADGGAAGIEVEGDQVGVIAQRGPDGGQATVHIDGEPAGMIELYAPEALGPEVVFVADLAPGAVSSISLVPTGTNDAASSGERVAIDGVVTLTAG